MSAANSLAKDNIGISLLTSNKLEICQCVLRHKAGQEGRGEILLENSCDDDATREK